MASMCFGWMQYRQNQHESERLLPAGDEAAVRDVLVERIRRHAATTSLLVGPAQVFVPQLRLWQEVDGSLIVQAHVRTALAADPALVAVLLPPFGNPDRTTITRDRYEVLSTIVHPDDVLTSLRAQGLLDPSCTDYLAGLAHSFAALHTLKPPPNQGPTTP